MKHLRRIGNWMGKHPVGTVYILAAAGMTYPLIHGAVDLKMLEMKRKRDQKACQRVFDEEFEELIKANF